MTLVPARRVDWKSQFSALRPYCEGRGGVVHIHAGPTSPTSAFARVVRAQLAADVWPFKWSTVQIDPTNASTHYIPDIIAQINKNVRLSLAEANQRPVTINIGNENDAGGNVIVSDIDIDFGSDGYGQSELESKRIDHLCVSLKAVLETRRVALIFVETHKSDANSLTRLGRKLWEGALGDLTQSGLLVVDIFDPALLAHRTYAWPPDPDLILQLPDRYDDQTRSEALADLASIALDESWFPTYEEAKAFALTVLAMSDDIRDIYARLGRVVAGLGAGANVRK